MSPVPELLKSTTEKAESFLIWLVGLLKGRKWITILLLLDIIFLIIFRPASVDAFLDSLKIGLELPKWYLLSYWAIILVISILAFILAYKSFPVKNKTSLTEITNRKVIKGLRPFEFDDAEHFAKLQRESSLRECLEAITDYDFRFGILCGDSGCGKTSFLQAGLWPALEITQNQCIYLRLTDSDPIDLIRQAVCKKFGLPRNKFEIYDFITFLKVSTAAESKPLVLLLDQFEQFFVHLKQKEQREPFIQALAQWFRHKPPLPVKVLICLRGDFYDHLIEFQKVMGYSLGPQQSFRLENFTPKEAAEIFQVIAATENLPIDTSFVEELTEKELASHEDGLISGVDLQILAWMIKGQRSVDEQAFTHKAYQKLGGIEGLLERFLLRTLQARETENLRQAALKVLLGLTDLDRNLRAGVLTADDLQSKLLNTASRDEIDEALEWLSRGDVRLVTPVKRSLILGYELAHERIIPALRKIIGKSLSAADQANQLLDRRVHEWQGNDRSNRYLLTMSELHLIKKQKPYLAWNALKAEKNTLISLSQRRFWVRTVAIALPLLSILTTMAWLFTPLDLPRGVVWVTELASADLLRQKTSLNTKEMKRLALALKKVGAFEKILQQMKKTEEPGTRALAMTNMAYLLALTEDTTRATEFLIGATHAAEQISSDGRKVRSLTDIASTIANIARDLKDVNFLQQAFDIAKAIDDPRGKNVFLDSYIIASAVIAGKANDVNRLRTTAKLVADTKDYHNKIDALGVIAASYMEIDTYSENNEFVQPVFEFVETLNKSKDLALETILKGISIIALDNGEANLIWKALELVNNLNSDKQKNDALFFFYKKTLEIAVNNNDQGLIDQAQTLADKISETWVIDETLSRLGYANAVYAGKNTDLKRLQKASDTCTRVHGLNLREICLAHVASATAKIAGATQNSELLNRALQIEKRLVSLSALDTARVGIYEAHLRFGNWIDACQIIVNMPDLYLRAMGFAAILETWSDRGNPILLVTHPHGIDENNIR